jgi:hypothetical protein
VRGFLHLHARNFSLSVTTIQVKRDQTWLQRQMMKNSNCFKTLSLLSSAAYFLSACGGTLPQSTISEKAPEVQTNVVAFTGIIEAMNDNQWTVSGQQVTIDPQISLNSSIKVGDRVKVDVNVSGDGALVALKVESSANDDIIPPAADASNTPDPLGTGISDTRVAPALSSTPNPSVTQVGGNNENEVFGSIESVGADTITVNGVTYLLADFTEIKDAIAVGDQVKLHVILNADAKLTIREIEKSDDLDGDNGNSNDSSDNSNDDDSDDNSNPDNSNDDSDDEPDDDSNENDSGSGSNSDSGDD